MAKKKNKSTRPPLPPPSAPPALSAATPITLPFHPKLNTPVPPQPQLSKNAMRKQNRKRNIAQEFDRYFGEDTKLENWQRLCRDVGIDDTLPSLTKCKLGLKKVWVNIYDLLDAVNAGSCPPYRFTNQAKLREYTLETKRIFPKEKAKEGGPVRALLAHIFR